MSLFNYGNLDERFVSAFEQIAVAAVNAANAYAKKVDNEAAPRYQVIVNVTATEDEAIMTRRINAALAKASRVQDR